MKTFVSILIISTFTLGAIQLSAQKISKADYNIFSSDNNLYQFQDMEDVFVRDFNSYQVYRSALVSRKKANIYGIVSLSTIAVGGLSILIDPSPDPNMYCDLFCVSTGVVIGVISFVLVLPAVATVGLVQRLTYNTKKNKAIKLFNNSQDIGHISNPEQWNLEVGGGQYGYGLVLNF
ncbi:hypothetical protein N9L92_04870 [Saprospiraceae bacterium]|nr:hypothetical protein [Saprospiraceae bacterium]